MKAKSSFIAPDEKIIDAFIEYMVRADYDTVTVADRAVRDLMADEKKIGRMRWAVRSAFISTTDQLKAVYTEAK